METALAQDDRPGYSSMILIIDRENRVVGREKDHLHAKSLALEIGHNIVEECQPERKQWRYLKGCWERVPSY